MTGMAMVSRLVLMVAAAAAFTAAVACGGGGDDEDTGKRDRITDPAKVPSATPMQNPTLFQITGDEVTLSGGATTRVTPTGSTPTTASTHTVVSGDLCGTIATRFGVSLDELLKANRSIDCASLRIGDQIKIPPKAATPTPVTGTTGLTGNPTTKPSGKTYTVKGGDTCADIAGSYGVKTADLIAKNSLDPNCQNLKIGQTLQIP